MGIVSVDWLNANLNNKKMVILDASLDKTINGNTANTNQLSIPYSRKFDIKKKFVDKTSQFPNTVPPATEFEKECQNLGINSDSEIIVYDNLGVYSSPRVWWLFKAMGHQNVKVLNGGLPEWIKNGFETVEKSTLKADFSLGNFKSTFQKDYLIRYEDVIENIDTKKFQVVDARSNGRFNGTSPEPRKHLQSGHIPNSVNIPYTDLLENGKFKSAEDLQHIFSTQVTEQDQLVFSCGSGLTACIVMLASVITFKKGFFLYDGSWTEYAELSNLTIN